MNLRIFVRRELARLRLLGLIVLHWHADRGRIYRRLAVIVGWCALFGSPFAAVAWARHRVGPAAAAAAASESSQGVSSFAPIVYEVVLEDSLSSAVSSLALGSLIAFRSMAVILSRLSLLAATNPCIALAFLACAVFMG